MLPAKNCDGITNESFTVLSDYSIALSQHMSNDKQPRQKHNLVIKRSHFMYIR